MNKRVWACALVFTVLRIAAAAEPSNDESDREDLLTGFSVLFENDVLFPEKNEDRDYTMGVIVQIDGPFVDRTGINLPLKFVDRLTGMATRHDHAADKEFTLHSLQIGSLAFTPDKIEDPNPIPDDRPYASLVYLQAGRQSVDIADNFALSTELSLGFLGLRFAEEVQTWIHEKMQSYPGDDPQTPRGWPNQISDGGEVTARYGVTGQWLLSCDRNYDLQLRGSGNLGYYTNAVVGLGARFGKIRSPWWNYASTPIKESAEFQRQAGDGKSGKCPSRNSTSKWELYGWVGVDATYWLYNVLLQGQFRDSAVTVSGSRMERLVADYQYGITGGFIAAELWWNLSYRRTRRTAEFDSIMNNRNHSWGGIFLTLSKPY